MLGATAGDLKALTRMRTLYLGPGYRLQYAWSSNRRCWLSDTPPTGARRLDGSLCVTQDCDDADAFNGPRTLAAVWLLRW